ncbi:hypothetical protein HDU88_006231 [Geranomyces variabilis]|nr:hypothetical protein HDU88_006231 [Geranomyces variabilis]
MHFSLLVAFVLSLGLATSVTSKPLTKRQANKRTLDSASSSSETSSASMAPACVPYSSPTQPGNTPKSCDQSFHASLALCSPSPPPSSPSSSSSLSAECAARAKARLATCRALCHPSSRQLAACAKGCAQVWILFRKDVCSLLGTAQSIEACGDVGDAQLYACQDICVKHLGAATGGAEGRTASSSSASAPAPGGSYDDTASSTAEVMTDIQVGGTGEVLANTDPMKPPALKIISRKGA